MCLYYTQLEDKSHQLVPPAPVNCICVRAWKGYCKKKEENDHNEQADYDDESPGDNDENVSVIAPHYLRKQYQYGHNNSSVSFPL